MDFDVMDTLHLKSLQFFGRHGTEDWEKETGRRFEVDVILYADMTRPGRSNRLADAHDYRNIHAATRRVVEGQSHDLIERIAWRVIEEIFKDFDVDQVTCRVAKPEAPIGGLNEAVVVEYTRTREQMKETP